MHHQTVWQLLNSKSRLHCSGTYFHEARNVWSHTWVSHLEEPGRPSLMQAQRKCWSTCHELGRLMYHTPSPPNFSSYWHQLRWFCLAFNAYILCRVGPAKGNTSSGGCTSSNSLSRICGNLKYLPKAGRNTVKYYAPSFQTSFKESWQTMWSHRIWAWSKVKQ